MVGMSARILPLCNRIEQEDSNCRCAWPLGRWYVNRRFDHSRHRYIMDCHSSLYHAALLRFFWLFRHGNRAWQDNGLLVSRKLRQSVQLGEHKRVLEALAYNTRLVHAQLPVHSSWRKPLLETAYVLQPVGCIPAVGTMAWRKLEFCNLGCISWILPCDGKIVSRKGLQAYWQGSKRVDYIHISDGRLGNIQD